MKYMTPRTFYITALYLVGVALNASNAYACEPCHPPSLQEAWAQADLVVVARGISSDKGSPICPVSDPQANYTEIEIQKVLKGSVKNERLKVPACYGMCDYGLLLGNTEPRLIFLRTTNKVGAYETLQPCKAPEPVVRQNTIELRGTWVPIEKALPRSDTPAR